MYPVLDTRLQQKCTLNGRTPKETKQAKVWIMLPAREGCSNLQGKVGATAIGYFVYQKIVGEPKFSKGIDAEKKKINHSL